MNVTPFSIGDVAARSSRWHDLGVRASSGVVLVAVAIATARAGGTVFIATWTLAAIAIQWEWQRLIDAPAEAARVLIGSFAVVAVAWLARLDLVEAAFTLTMFAAVQAILAHGRRVWAAAGLIYAGALIMAVLALRFSFPFGGRSIIWLFATVWSTDIFAYFGGRFIGGPKLWPRVSPSKTWAGTLSGVAAGALIGTFVVLRDLPGPTAVAPVLALTLATAMVSQAGDAFESAVKRAFGVKDSSRLIPGHGGIMDRLDGFIAAAVFAFGFGILRDLPSVALGLFYWA